MLIEHISEKKKQKGALAQRSSVTVESFAGPSYQEEGTVKGEQAWPSEKENQDLERLRLLGDGTDTGLPSYGQVMKA